MPLASREGTSHMWKDLRVIMPTHQTKWIFLCESLTRFRGSGCGEGFPGAVIIEKLAKICTLFETGSCYVVLASLELAAIPVPPCWDYESSLPAINVYALILDVCCILIYLNRIIFKNPVLNKERSRYKGKYGNLTTLYIAYFTGIINIFSNKLF